MQGSHGVLERYIDALTLAGAGIVLIPLQVEDHSVEVLSRCHGLVLTGGESLDTAVRDADREGLEDVDPQRDRFETRLATLAVANAIPVLGICRGLHILNATWGGTLAPVARVAGMAERHAAQAPHTMVSHRVLLTKGSALAAIHNNDQATLVNSRHNYCVDVPAAGFEIAARSEAGVIEALERPGKAPCVGVQWHPELLAAEGDQSATRLFTWFTDHCAEKALG